MYKGDDYSSPRHPNSVVYDGPRNYGHGDKHSYHDNTFYKSHGEENRDRDRRSREERRDAHDSRDLPERRSRDHRGYRADGDSWDNYDVYGYYAFDQGHRPQKPGCPPPSASRQAHYTHQGWQVLPKMGRLAKTQKYNPEADMAELPKFSSISKMGQPTGTPSSTPIAEGANTPRLEATTVTETGQTTTQTPHVEGVVEGTHSLKCGTGFKPGIHARYRSYNHCANSNRRSRVKGALVSTTRTGLSTFLWEDGPGETPHNPPEEDQEET